MAALIEYVVSELPLSETFVMMAPGHTECHSCCCCTWRAEMSANISPPCPPGGAAPHVPASAAGTRAQARPRRHAPAHRQARVRTQARRRAGRRAGAQAGVRASPPTPTATPCPSPQRRHTRWCGGTRFGTLRRTRLTSAHTGVHRQARSRRRFARNFVLRVQTG